MLLMLSTKSRYSRPQIFEDVSSVVMIMEYVDLLILRTYRVLHV